MIRKWLARGMIALMAAILGYFVFLSADMTLVPIEKGGNLTGEDAQGELARGRGVNWLRVDSEGSEIMSGSSEKVSQLDERNLRLADGLRLSLNKEGTLYEVRADRLEEDENGNKLMYANPGGLIELSSEEGLTIRTAGPLIQTPDEVLMTEAEAVFVTGEAKGRCTGLRFQPEVFLELSADAFFEANGNGQDIRIQADSIRFDNRAQTGLVTNGIMQSRVDGISDLLIADTITLSYLGGQRMEPFRLINARLEGDDALFVWQEGQMISSYFMICFDSTGKRVDELYTAADARFDVITSDGYDLFGAGGQLILEVENARPSRLQSKDPIALYGERAFEPPLRMRGDAGMESTFFEGKATSTEIFGMPSFSYGQQAGEAGNLRLVHKDHDLVLSGRALLRDNDQKIRVQADRILFSDWDTDNRQMFAFDFVDIALGEGDGSITGTGKTMEYQTGTDQLILTGEPARVLRTADRVEAEQIIVTRVDEETYDLDADRGVDVSLTLARGQTNVKAGKMKLTGEESLVKFFDVQRAEMPGMGALSCGYLEAGLKERNGEQILEYLTGSNDLLLEGTVIKDGEPKPMSCRADRMNYRAGENKVYFEGEGRDLVFTHPDHNLRGRHLTYNLNDGSIRLGPQKQTASRPNGNLKPSLR